MSSRTTQPRSNFEHSCGMISGKAGDVVAGRLFRYPKLFLLITFLLTLTSIPVSAKTTLQDKVMKVSDGDTIIVSPIEGGQFFKCRLYGIDAPETAKGRKPGQPYGEEAAKELKHLILGQTVEITLTGAKTYKREVCMVRKEGMDINLEMVKRGYAWAYVRYLKRPYASEYIEAENEARTKRLGLWQDANPQPPWEFRKMTRGR
jgi:micrococcal nuclease